MTVSDLDQSKFYKSREMREMLVSHCKAQRRTMLDKYPGGDIFQVQNCTIVQLLVVRVRHVRKKTTVAVPHGCRKKRHDPDEPKDFYG